MLKKSSIFYFLFLFLTFLLISCSKKPVEKSQKINESSVRTYLKNLEDANHIDYQKIENRGIYIPPMCFTKTLNEDGNRSNPCYVCHNQGREPNYVNDIHLQVEYSFPPEMRKNPYTNLFKDRQNQIKELSDAQITKYIKISNYFDSERHIILEKKLPKEWQGFVPDCHYNFDDSGFDRRTKDQKYTLWRAFRYYPFLGSFMPTNGSTDDVLIRLAKDFSLDQKGRFNIDVYSLNLSIVESLIKQKDVYIQETDEKKYQVDLDQNGVLGIAKLIRYVFPSKNLKKMSYVGQAKLLLEQGKRHLAGGLYPVGTEFLHSVRYLGWDRSAGRIKLSERMKELRYSIKEKWRTYAQLREISESEYLENLGSVGAEISLEYFSGNAKIGLKNRQGWRYQAFIEDKNGDLRPQTRAETLQCMGCHSSLAVTTDSSFSLPRKFEYASLLTDHSDSSVDDTSWLHWNQEGINNVAEALIDLSISGEKILSQGEYSFYLLQNNSGNEFGTNSEIRHQYFNIHQNKKQVELKEKAWDRLTGDISTLLHPSYKRAQLLNKIYRILVKEQNFVKGRIATQAALKTVHKVIKAKQMTEVEKMIVLKP